MRILLLALAGSAGTLARYGVERLVQGRGATLTVNLVGSFLVGLIMHYATRSAMSPQLRGMLTIGFCGAFTTMSTFSYETLGLFTQGSYARAALYMTGTIAGCLGAVLLGMLLAEQLAGQGVGR